MLYLPIEIYLISFLALIAIISLTLFILEYKSRKSLIKHILETSSEDAEKQSNLMILEAIKKSEQIISQAQVQATTNISQTNKNIQEIGSKYQQQYDNLFQEINKRMSTDLVNMEAQYASYLEYLSSSSKNIQNSSSVLLEQRLNQLIENFEQNLTNFFTKTQQRSIESIDLELKSARQLIDSYRQKQLMLLDDNLIAILERTLSLVLTKNLSLQDQVDLVNEAIEQEKIEKFIT